MQLIYFDIKKIVSGAYRINHLAEIKVLLSVLFKI